MATRGKTFCLILLQIIISSFTPLCRGQERNLPFDTLNPRIRVYFHFMDSIYPCTVFFTSDDFYIDSGFVERPDNNNEFQFYRNKVYYIDYPLLSDSILELYSSVPSLLIRDTIAAGLLSEHGIDHELYYSYILRLLNEPSLYTCSNIEAIRRMRNYGGLLISDRIEITDEGVEHVRSFVRFNEPGSFDKVIKKRTLKSKKHEQGFHEIGKELGLENQKYFSTLNLQESYPSERTIIEYRNINKYYIIRTPFYMKPYSKSIKRIRNF